MRADRLLSILLLLEDHSPINGKTLAERLEVSERTIHRDMDALSQAGVPVYAVRGPRGGWALDPAYHTDLNGLNLTETQALALNIPAQLLNDLGLKTASEAAYIKLLSALPGTRRQSAAFMRQRIHFDLSGWQSYEEPAPFLPVLQDALWQEQQTHLSYQRNDGCLVERVVDPWGLVAKGCVWYLVAGVDGEPRTYRVSRIQAARLEDHPSQRPEAFDLAAFWQQSTGDFRAGLPRYPATVRLAPGLLERLRYAGRYTRLDKVEILNPPDESGWQTVRIQFEKAREAEEYLLSFGAQIEVLDPPELRERIVAQAEALVLFYREKNTSLSAKESSPKRAAA
jgi:predicted DNA-binding transcriptional regulator YafY